MFSLELCLLGNNSMVCICIGMDLSLFLSFQWLTAMFFGAIICISFNFFILFCYAFVVSVYFINVILKDSCQFLVAKVYYEFILIISIILEIIVLKGQYVL